MVPGDGSERRGRGTPRDFVVASVVGSKAVAPPPGGGTGPPNPVRASGASRGASRLRGGWKQTRLGPPGFPGFPALEKLTWLGVSCG